MKIAVFGKQFGDDFIQPCEMLFRELIKLKCEVIVFKPFLGFINQKVSFDFNWCKTFEASDDLLGSNLVLSIGGDGTFLEAVTFVRNSNIPIAGINSGRLGFLADISREEIPQVLLQIVTGNYKLKQLDLLEVVTPLPVFGDLNFALNEFALTKRDNASMITVHAWLNNEFLNAYWADGLIIATATGSTAYSLSVGGPILHPNAPNFVISPIAPHNLTVRPFVIPNQFELKLNVNARGGKFMASLDSRSVALDEGLEIVVRKAGFAVNIIELPNQNFYNTLRSKLMWGADKRN